MNTKLPQLILSLLTVCAFEARAAESGLYHIDDFMDLPGGAFHVLLSPETHGDDGWAPIDHTFDGTVLIKFTYTPIQSGPQTFANYWSYMLLRNPDNSIKFRVGTDHGTDVFVAPVAGAVLQHGGFPIVYEQKPYEIQVFFDYTAGGDDSAVVIINDMVFTMPNGDYTFSIIQGVAAHDTGGPGAHFTNMSVEVREDDPGPPPAPTGLAAVAGDGHISLTWNAVAGADSYNVKRSVSGGTLEVIATTNTPGYTDTDVTNEVTYDYAVSAVSSLFGEGNDSPIQSATPVPGPDVWAGFELDQDGVADTDVWLGRVRVLGGNWIEIEDFDTLFFALPTDEGVWLYRWDGYPFNNGHSNPDSWLGVAQVLGDWIYSHTLGHWFHAHVPSNGEGAWFYSVRIYPTIPEDRLFSWDPGVRGGIPDVPVAIELEPGDLPTGPGSNAAPAIQAAIDQVYGSGEPGAVLLPEGTYYISRAILMRPNVVLRGRGLDKTSILIDDADFASNSAIAFHGTALSEELTIVGGYEAGSSILEVANSRGLAPGRMAWLRSENDLDAMYGDNETFLEAGTIWARRAVSQVARIVDVTTTTVELDTPARLSRMHLSPVIASFNPIEYAGLESLHIRYEQDVGHNIVSFLRAANCWVRDCEFEMTIRTHVGLSQSRHITVENNYIHHAHNYGGGGHGYGVVTGHSTDNLIWNNVFRMLRHAMLTSNGANGNVWAFNYSQEQNQEGGGWGTDFSVHGHYPYMELFEGNRGEYAMSSDWWGAAGPLVTFFRNRFDPSTHATGAPGSFRIQYQSHYQNVIGNSFVVGQSIVVSGDSEEAYVEGNMIQGRIVWNEAEPFPLPTSVFLNQPPHFWGDTPWPAIGADLDLKAFDAGEDYIRIPAQVWAERMFAENRTMPFAEAFAD